MGREQSVSAQDVQQQNITLSTGTIGPTNLFRSPPALTPLRPLKTWEGMQKLTRAGCWSQETTRKHEQEWTLTPFEMVRLFEPYPNASQLFRLQHANQAPQCALKSTSATLLHGIPRTVSAAQISKRQVSAFSAKRRSAW